MQDKEREKENIIPLWPIGCGSRIQLKLCRKRMAVFSRMIVMYLHEATERQETFLGELRR